MAFCTNCGKKLEEGAEFCTFCGAVRHAKMNSTLQGGASSQSSAGWYASPDLDTSASGGGQSFQQPSSGGGQPFQQPSFGGGQPFQQPSSGGGQINRQPVQPVQSAQQASSHADWVSATGSVPPPPVEKKESQKKSMFWNIASTLIIVGAIKFFGPLPALLGSLAGLLILRTVGKNHPDETWPNVLAVVVGIVVALATGIGFAILLLGDSSY